MTSKLLAPVVIGLFCFLLCSLFIISMCSLSYGKQQVVMERRILTQIFIGMFVAPILLMLWGKQLNGRWVNSSNFAFYVWLFVEESILASTMLALKG